MNDKEYSKDDTPDPTWNEMRTVPMCSDDGCRCFDGKRCRLMGFEPDSICEPAVQAMGEAMQVVLANNSMTRQDVESWLLGGLQTTAQEFFVCPACGGSGEQDTGGFNSDGSSISTYCDACEGSGIENRSQ